MLSRGHCFRSIGLWTAGPALRMIFGGPAHGWPKLRHAGLAASWERVAAVAHALQLFHQELPDLDGSLIELQPDAVFPGAAVLRAYGDLAVELDGELGTLRVDLERVPLPAGPDARSAAANPTMPCAS